MPADGGDEKGRVLIVDDIEMNRKLLRAHLRSEGFGTFEARDGAEAMALLQREPVDAIVSDILMPNMDGYRLCVEVRTHPELRKLPFVVYSATYVSPADEQLAVEAGADRYFRKPADLSALIHAVKELVHERHPVSARPIKGAVGNPELKTYDEKLIRTLLERTERLAESERRYRRIMTQVFRTLGRGGASVLYQSGLESGNSIYGLIQDLYKPQGDAEFASALMAYAKLSGLGDMDEFRIDRGKSEIHVAVSGTFEPGIHETPGKPVCHFLRGILAGIGNHLLNESGMDCREVACRATGGRLCAFVVKRLFPGGAAP